MWTGQLHVYSGKINSSHVDLHVWASGAVIVRTRLRYLLVAQAGSNVREGGSDASAFGALSIHSPMALQLLKRIILVMQCTNGDLSRLKFVVRTRDIGLHDRNIKEAAPVVCSGNVVCLPSSGS